MIWPSCLRLHRHYSPTELLVGETQGGVGLLCQRLEQLAAFLQTPDFASEAELAEPIAELQAGATRLREAETELSAFKEKDLLARVAGKLRAQSINTSPPA